MLPANAEAKKKAGRTARPQLACPTETIARASRVRGLEAIAVSARTRCGGVVRALKHEQVGVLADQFEPGCARRPLSSAALRPQKCFSRMRNLSLFPHKPPYTNSCRLSRVQRKNCSGAVLSTFRALADVFRSQLPVLRERILIASGSSTVPRRARRRIPHRSL